MINFTESMENLISSFFNQFGYYPINAEVGWAASIALRHEATLDALGPDRKEWSLQSKTSQRPISVRISMELGPKDMKISASFNPKALCTLEMPEGPKPERPKEAGGGMRFNGNKLGIDQLPIELIVELSRVYTVGAIKYFKGNWLNGMDWSIMVECADRHWFKWLAGMTTDPETGCHHLALAIWNLTALLVYQMRGLGNDDRTLLPLDENFNWTSGPAALLGLGLPPEKLKEMEEKYRPMREAAIAAMKAAKVSEGPADK